MLSSRKIATKWYPFGMLAQNYNAKSYRFGFNGKEMDNEVVGCGNIYNYGFRIYNPPLAKFLSRDPLFQTYPWLTPYQFAGNDPIRNIDIDGMEGGSSIEREAWEEFLQPLLDYFNSLFSSTESTPSSSSPSPYSQQPGQPSPPVKTKQNKPAIKKSNNEYIVQTTITNNANINHWVSMFDENGKYCQNCAVASQKTLANNGNKQAWTKIQMAQENKQGTEIHITSSDEIQKGIEYINSELKKGHYVKVGVHHTLSSKSKKYKAVGIANRDNTTDHWITIVDLKYDKKVGKFYYRYFENGTKHKNKGVSEQNKLYINDDGTITAKGDASENGNNGKNYQLSQIRLNQKQ